jgi:hypothetical protein
MPAVGLALLKLKCYFFSDKSCKFSIFLPIMVLYVTSSFCPFYRRYFFLITFRSYLYCTSAAETEFTSWMDARPELGHLCNNLRIDKWFKAYSNAHKLNLCIAANAWKVILFLAKSRLVGRPTYQQRWNSRPGEREAFPWIPTTPIRSLESKFMLGKGETSPS